MYSKEKQYKIAMILLCPVQGPWASSFSLLYTMKLNMPDIENNLSLIFTKLGNRLNVQTKDAEIKSNSRSGKIMPV